jgi:glucosyl-dolichyl phosphate glucuronosyltransferase
MEISVLICTFNRRESLCACLDRLAKQEHANLFDWEVVVVDNNCTDGTDKMIADMSRVANFKLRYLKEEKQGLNYARNSGALGSNGKYFVFIDDDIYVSPTWLTSMYGALERSDADAVGGRIHLDPSLVLPVWIQPEIYGFLGYQDCGEVPFQMDGIKKYPFGGNMAFNRRVTDMIGLFNAELGRRGVGEKRTELFKGAETDYFHRLARAGGKIFYEPSAIVYHQIKPFQLTKRYFRTIHFNEGYQRAQHDERAFERTLLGIPYFLFSQTARSLAHYIGDLITQGPSLSFRQQMTVGHFLGMMAGYTRR